MAVARKKIVDPMHPVFAWTDKPKTSAFLTTVLAGISNPFQRTSDRTLPRSVPTQAFCPPIPGGARLRQLRTDGLDSEQRMDEMLRL